MILEVSGFGVRFTWTLKNLPFQEITVRNPKKVGFVGAKVEFKSFGSRGEYRDPKTW